MVKKSIENFKNVGVLNCVRQKLQLSWFFLKNNGFFLLQSPFHRILTTYSIELFKKPLYYLTKIEGFKNSKIPGTERKITRHFIKEQFSVLKSRYWQLFSGKILKYWFYRLYSRTRAHVLDDFEIGEWAITSTENGWLNICICISRGPLWNADRSLVQWFLGPPPAQKVKLFTYVE